jgi:hypothetical protein
MFYLVGLHVDYEGVSTAGIFATMEEARAFRDSVLDRYADAIVIQTWRGGDYLRVESYCSHTKTISVKELHDPLQETSSS